jgi:hypothetical protein
MTEVYKFKGWTISNKAGVYTAHNGNGFFTGYHACSCPGAFLDILNSQYATI